VTLGWGLKFLARNPDVQRRLRNEVLSKMPPPDEKAPDVADVATENFPYLEALVSEMLRHSCTAELVTREAMIDSIVLGCHIPKGTIVMLQTSGIGFLETEDYKTAAEDLNAKRSQSSKNVGRKTGYWKDPEVFDPERWMKDGQYNPRAGPSLPFSAGPRACFGFKLALLDLKLFLVYLSTTFFLDTVPTEFDTNKSPGGITKTPTDCYIKLREWEC